MPDIVIETTSAEDTQRVARSLGEACTGGETFLLTGPLGSGKTCFTQGLAWGLGVQEYAHSPTFVLVNEYQGRHALYHLDLYRVESQEEAMDLGLQEYLTAGGVCAIEWADKVLGALAPRGLLVEMEHLGAEQRRLTLRPIDQHHEGLCSRLSASAIPRT